MAYRKLVRPAESSTQITDRKEHCVTSPESIAGTAQSVLAEVTRKPTVEFLAPLVASAIGTAQQVAAMRQYIVELEAVNEDLDAFAHTAAHNLKNPLGNVIGFAEILEQDCTAMSAEELRRYLRTIARNGRKMKSIIDDLLLLASAQMNDVELQPLDMATIIDQALERLALMIEKHQAEIAVPDVWPVALGYAPWVEEVWENYISNAIKYGGHPPRVELGFDAADNSQPSTLRAGTTGSVASPTKLCPPSTDPHPLLRYWVRDNGRGLTPEAQTRLFTPFTRLEPRCAEGHGLGLFIVRKTVEKLGGQVDVESVPDQGSVFAFTLPSVVIQAAEND